MTTIPTISKLSASTSSETDEENRVGYETDLSAEHTDDEIHADTSSWSTADRKKLQHVTEFHQEYQHVFGVGASIQTIMKRRISHMNPPIPKAMCEEEMQSVHLDNSKVIIEYMTDAQGNRIRKLKPIFIKSKPDRECTHHVDSDVNLPAVPEENFTQKREVTVDSYSESISSDNNLSNDRTIMADSNSFAAPAFEEMPCEWEADPKGIEATLHQITASLQSAAEGYLALASNMSKVAPYELPQACCSDSSSPYGCPYAYSKGLIG